MFTSPPAPDAGAVGAEFVDNVGNQLLDAVVGLAPIAVPFVLSMLAIRWVMSKFGVAGGGAFDAGGGAFDGGGGRVSGVGDEGPARGRCECGYVQAAGSKYCTDCREYFEGDTYEGERDEAGNYR